MNENTLNVHILEAVVSRKYPQNPLLNADEFVSYLKDRVSHVWKGDLEELDRAGLFCPLIKVNYASAYHRILSRDEDGVVDRWEDEPLIAQEVTEEDDHIIQLFHPEPNSLLEWQEARDEGRVIFRSPNNFEPWDTLRTDGTTTATLFYHPFQMFRYLRATAATRGRINLLDHPSTPDEAWETFEYFQKKLDQSRTELQSNILWKKHLLLLLLMEDKYLPTMRDEVSYHEYSFRAGYNWEEWAADFNAKHALEASQMSIEEVAKFRHSVALDADSNDPTSSWFSIIRHMPYDQRKGAKGDVRLAWDRYEITEMLGDFLADLTGEQQRLPDDILWPGNWKTRAFGIPVEQIDYKKGNALPSILRHYGLDPRSRVYVFVEGETEENFIKEWFSGYDIDLPSSRVIVVNLRSHSGLSNPAFLDQAQQARNQEAAIYVLVDEDGHSAKRVADLQDWIEKGFIGRIFTETDMEQPSALPIGGFIWEPCFEDHNFTLDELLIAWRRMLETEYGEDNINESGFAEGVEDVRGGYYDTHIKAIEDVTKLKKRDLLNAGSAQFSKVKMGRSLAQLYRESENPINKILQFIVYVASLRNAIYRPTSR